MDVETTGFSCEFDEIVEFAIRLFRYDRGTGRVLGDAAEYCGLREPDCAIRRRASAVHGLTRRDVRGCRLDCARIRALMRQADFVVAHNAEFDRRFLERALPFFRRATWLCSCREIDWRAKGFESRRLGDLAARHGIEQPNPHRAGSDAEVLLRLLGCRRGRGRTHLYELLRNAGLM